MPSLQNSGDRGLTQTQSMRRTGRKSSHHALVTSDWRGANSAKESSANLAPRQHWWKVLQTYGGFLKRRRCQNIRLETLRTTVDMNIRFGFEQVPGFLCEWYCDRVGFVDTQGCMHAGRFDVGVGVVLVVVGG